MHTTRAIGVNAWDCTAADEASKSAAAPSFTPLALPAVTDLSAPLIDAGGDERDLVFDGQSVE